VYVSYTIVSDICSGSRGRHNYYTLRCGADNTPLNNWHYNPLLRIYVIVSRSWPRAALIVRLAGLALCFARLFEKPLESLAFWYQLSGIYT